MVEPTKTTKRKTATKKAPSAASQASLVSSLTAGWRHASKRQIDFAQENTTEYFKALRAIANAKDAQESMATIGRFAKDTVKRQTAQAREMGALVSGVQKEVTSRLAKLRPGSRNK